MPHFPKSQTFATVFTHSCVLLSNTRFHYLFQTLVFSATNIHSFHQINALTNIRRLDNLTIDLDGNSITKFNLWRPYIVFRLAHFALKKINNIEVRKEDS